MNPKQEKDLEQVCGDVRRILFHLENDDRADTEGLISKVNRIDKQLIGLLTREKVYIAKFTAYGFAGGAVGSIVLKFFWMLLDTVFKSKGIK